MSRDVETGTAVASETERVMRERERHVARGVATTPLVVTASLLAHGQA